VPPSGWPAMIFLSVIGANIVKSSSQQALARFYAHGRLYHGK
jgi:hypothetical protein